MYHSLLFFIPFIDLANQSRVEKQSKGRSSKNEWMSFVDENWYDNEIFSIFLFQGISNSP